MKAKRNQTQWSKLWNSNTPLDSGGPIMDETPETDDGWCTEHCPCEHNRFTTPCEGDHNSHIQAWHREMDRVRDSYQPNNEPPQYYNGLLLPL